MNEPSNRSRAVTGLIAAALFVAGTLVVSDLFGAFGDPDDYFRELHADPARRTRFIIGGYLLGACGLALLIFFEHVLAALQMATRVEALWSRIARSAMIAGVALFLAGSAALVTVPAAKTFGKLFGDETLDSAAVSVAPQLGYLLIFHFAMWGFALAITAIFIQARSAAVWPRWLGWLSIGAVPCLLVSSALFMPIVAFPVWICCVALTGQKVAESTAWDRAAEPRPHPDREPDTSY